MLEPNSAIASISLRTEENITTVFRREPKWDPHLVSPGLYNPSSWFEPLPVSSSPICNVSFTSSTNFYLSRSMFLKGSCSWENNTPLKNPYNTFMVFLLQLVSIGVDEQNSEYYEQP
jgi:hypothetical protein